MATKYVNSAAGGANDGTSWTDAWTSLSSSTGVSAGDVVKVHKAHTQSPGANLTLNWSNGTAANPVKILVVDKDASDALAQATDYTIANATKTITLDGHVVIYGIKTKGASHFFLSSSKRLYAEKCSFNIDSNVFAGSGFFLCQGFAAKNINTFIDCDWSFAADTSIGANTCFSMNSAAACRALICGGTVTLVSSQTRVCSGASSDVEFRGVSFSGTVTNLIVNGSLENIRFVECKLPSFTNYISATPNLGSSFTFERCSNSASITVPDLGLTRYETECGVVSSSLSRYRTGGANDGLNANAHSWEMVSNSSCLTHFVPLVSPPMAVWTDAKSSISSATSKGILTSKRLAFLGSAAALTTDGTSTWTGTGVGTKQKITHTLINGSTLTFYVASGVTLNDDEFWIVVDEPDQVGGPTMVRCYLAKASTTVYVDPKIDISTSTRQWFANGSQFQTGNESGGSAGMLFIPNMDGA